MIFRLYCEDEVKASPETFAKENKQKRKPRENVIQSERRAWKFSESLRGSPRAVKEREGEHKSRRDATDKVKGNVTCLSGE